MNGQRLALQEWMTARSALRVMGALNGVEHDCARYVGGCVRNALLGEPVGDVDIATKLTPAEVMGALAAVGVAVHPTGIEHGTVTAVADSVPYEITTLRKDVETDGRRAVVAFTDDWDEDARRRDFRLNALYASQDGTIHDPTGCGLADLSSRRVVFVGEPSERIREDYLRILRFFRFNAWYGAKSLDAAGLSACAMLRDGLSQISSERIWAETKKLLAAPRPIPALRAMAQTGVLAQIVPEAHGLALLPGLVETELAAGLAPDSMLRLMALFSKDPDILERVARALKMSNAERIRVVSAASDASEISSNMSERHARRLLYSIGPAVFRDRLILGHASQPGPDRSAENLKVLLELVDTWTKPTLPVDGRDVIALGASSGPNVGDMLRAMDVWWADTDFSADRSAALEKLRALAAPGVDAAS